MVKKTAKHLAPYQFKKGNKANPKGAAAHDSDLKKVRALSREQLADIGSLVVKQDFATVKQIARSETGHSALRVWVARIVETGIYAGSDSKLDNLMNRIIGPVPKDIGVTITSPHAGKTKEQLAKEIQEIEEIISISEKKEITPKAE